MVDLALHFLPPNTDLAHLTKEMERTTDVPIFVAVKTLGIPRNLWKTEQGFTLARITLSQSFIARDWTDLVPLHSL